MPTTSRERLSIILLADDRPSHAENVLEHIRALRSSRHDLTVFNPVGVERPLLVDLDRFDVVVIHYTVVAVSDSYLAPAFRERIEAHDGLKVQFLQDEYRWVDDVTAMSRRLGVRLLYSLVPEAVVPTIYGPRLPETEVRTTLAGFVPRAAVSRPRVPLGDRPLDVVYRGRSVPFWLGRLGQDKVEIGRGFVERAQRHVLAGDVAWTEIDRIYGRSWYAFLESGRTTLGTESGASIVDFDGTIERATAAYLLEHPSASFDEVEGAILAPHEGNAEIRVVSPRAFEAAAVGTAMVNFRGGYSGILEAWRHYVPLEHDFSNFDEVVEAIRDRSLLETLTHTAYEELVASRDYSLERFVREFDDDVERLAERRRRKRPATGLVRARSALNGARARQAPPLAAARLLLRTRLRDELITAEPTLAAMRSTLAAGRSTSERDRLDEDLLRLAIVLRARGRRLGALTPDFVVVPRLIDNAAHLALTSSYRAPDEDALAATREATITAIRNGTLRSIRWNHSPVGLGVLFVRAGRRISVDVGYDVVYGAHSFTALARAAATHPAEIVALLEPLWEPIAPELPEAPTPVRIGASFELRPLWLARRGAAATGAVVGAPALRTLLLRSLSDAGARRLASPAVVLSELAKLRAIHDARCGSLAGVAKISVDLESDSDGRSLRIRTHAGNGAVRRSAACDPELLSALEELVWDNSALGREFPFPGSNPRMKIVLEPGGQFRFRALVALAPRLADTIAGAIAYAVGEQ